MWETPVSPLFPFSKLLAEGVHRRKGWVGRSVLERGGAGYCERILRNLPEERGSLADDSRILFTKLRRRLKIAVKRCAGTVCHEGRPAAS